MRRLRFTRKLLLLLLLLLHLLLLVVLQPPRKIVRLRPRQLPLNFFFFIDILCISGAVSAGGCKSVYMGWLGFPVRCLLFMKAAVMICFMNLFLRFDPQPIDV